MRQVNLIKNGGKDMVEVMTDRQYDGILQMIEMIVNGCKDLEEAKRKIAELRKEKKEKTE
jgi:predicted ArsR family transcriptional regulator